MNKRREASGFYDEENGIIIHIDPPKITLPTPMVIRPLQQAEVKPIKPKSELKITEITPLIYSGFPQPTARSVG